MEATNDTKYVKCADENYDGEITSVGYSHKVHGEPVGTKSKKELIDDLRTGEQYEVAIREGEKWRTERIRIHEDKWLRLDDEETPEDDLDKIPECS